MAEKDEGSKPTTLSMSLHVLKNATDLFLHTLDHRLAHAMEGTFLPAAMEGAGEVAAPVAKMGLAEMFACAEILKGTYEAIQHARHGDWDKFTEATVEIPNAAMSLATHGGYGVAMGVADALLAINHVVNGAEAATYEGFQAESFIDFQNRLVDYGMKLSHPDGVTIPMNDRDEIIAKYHETAAFFESRQGPSTSDGDGALHLDHHTRERLDNPYAHGSGHGHGAGHGVGHPHPPGHGGGHAPADTDTMSLMPHGADSQGRLPEGPTHGGSSDGDRHAPPQHHGGSPEHTLHGAGHGGRHAPADTDTMSLMPHGADSQGRLPEGPTHGGSSDGDRHAPPQHHGGSPEHTLHGAGHGGRHAPADTDTMSLMPHGADSQGRLPEGATHGGSSDGDRHAPPQHHGGSPEHTLHGAGHGGGHAPADTDTMSLMPHGAGSAGHPAHGQPHDSPAGGADPDSSRHAGTHKQVVNHIYDALHKPAPHHPEPHPVLDAINAQRDAPHHVDLVGGQPDHHGSGHE